VDKIVLGFITSFLVVLLATPALIKMAKMKHLVDEPLEARKLHRRSIPTIGGIIMFAGTLLSYALWFPFGEITEYQPLVISIYEFKYLVSSLLILFFIGIKDDIVGIAPVKKLMGHIVVAFILVMMGDIRVTSMHGILGIYDIAPWASILFSVFVYILVVNAFNLIDGVDGLAAGIGFICSVIFGIWFYLVGNISLSMLAFVLAGSLIGFLIFNYSPAKIFMGDSGSMTLGVIMSVLAIRAIETDTSLLPENFQYISPPIFAMAVLSYPLMDTLRVFIYRAIRGISPFLADKNHIHHKLIMAGLSHSQTVLLLYLYNIVFVVLTVFLGIEDPTITLGVVAGSAIAVTQLIYLLKTKVKLK